MATSFPLYTGEGYVDPDAERIRKLEEQLAKPMAPMYTPEQVAQRRGANERQHALGLLGQLSGDAGFGAVGGTLFKQALAEREKRQTARGSFDPISGEFTQDPAYARELLEGQLEKTQGQQATRFAQYQEARTKAQERAEDRRAQREWQASQNAAIRALKEGNEPLVQTLDENGNAVYTRRSDAIGKRAAPAGGGQPTGDERNAAGFAARMVNATGLLDKYEKSGVTKTRNEVAGAIPLIGDYARRNSMTREQQLYRQAAEDWVRAKLRKESGASIGDGEMDREIATYFPQPGDLPDTIEQKRQAREIANQGMLSAAGRAPLPTVNRTGAGGASGGWDAAGGGGGGVVDFSALPQPPQR